MLSDAVKPTSGFVPRMYVPGFGRAPVRANDSKNFPSAVVRPIPNRPAAGAADDWPLYEPADPPVTVAEKLNDKNLDALKTALKSVTGKDITLNVRVDPSIIGGLVVKLGSRMVDSSLRTKLNSIKHAMKEAG